MPLDRTEVLPSGDIQRSRHEFSIARQHFPTRSVHLRANDFVNLMISAVVMASSGDAR
jgi:hypothetical protein